jgi:hypothetical protein
MTYVGSSKIGALFYVDTLENKNTTNTKLLEPFNILMTSGSNIINNIDKMTLAPRV